MHPDERSIAIQIYDALWPASFKRMSGSTTTTRTTQWTGDPPSRAGTSCAEVPSGAGQRQRSASERPLWLVCPMFNNLPEMPRRNNQRLRARFRRFDLTEHQIG